VPASSDDLSVFQLVLEPFYSIGRNPVPDCPSRKAQLARCALRRQAMEAASFSSSKFSIAFLAAFSVHLLFHDDLMIAFPPVDACKHRADLSNQQHCKILGQK
jgi:hypothetical protein